MFSITDPLLTSVSGTSQIRFPLYNIKLYEGKGCSGNSNIWFQIVDNSVITLKKNQHWFLKAFFREPFELNLKGELWKVAGYRKKKGVKKRVHRWGYKKGFGMQVDMHMSVLDFEGK